MVEEGIITPVGVLGSRRLITGHTYISFLYKIIPIHETFLLIIIAVAATPSKVAASYR